MPSSSLRHRLRAPLRCGLVVLLGLIVTGCCDPPEDPTTPQDFAGAVAGDELDAARTEKTDEARCERACSFLAESEGYYFIDEVLTCAAALPDAAPGDPWDPSRAKIDVTCTVDLGPSPSHCPR